ncbi:MAG: PEGA domain-containing protein [Polyangia bacterium]
MQKCAAYVVVVALCLTGVSARSVADDPISRGLQLRKEGRDEEALPFFQRALREQRAPRAFGQLGTCEQALGLWVEAEAHITEALAHPRDPWVQKNEDALRTARDYVQARLGSIEVWGKPDGASVSIDGNAVGVLPLAKPARAAVGQRKLAVEAAGYQPERRSIDVSAGALVREHVVLQAATVAEQPKVNVIRQGGDGDGNPRSLDPSAIPAGAGPAIYRRWWFWVAVGAVTVAAGGTAYYFATRNEGCQAAIGGTCTTF